jgi:hypothetical protein
MASALSLIEWSRRREIWSHLKLRKEWRVLGWTNAYVNFVEDYVYTN